MIENRMMAVILLLPIAHYHPANSIILDCVYTLLKYKNISIVIELLWSL